MDESTYLSLADRALKAITAAVDELDPDLAEADLHGDVLEIELAQGPKCVINTQRPTRQLWVAARARAWHFSWDAARQEWRDDKDPSIELFAKVREIVREGSGADLSLGAAAG